MFDAPSGEASRCRSAGNSTDVFSLRDSLLQISRLSACHADRFAKGFAGRIGTTVKTNCPSAGGPWVGRLP
jgi:hypothetical protein